jgi:hypothetical protein
MFAVKNWETSLQIEADRLESNCALYICSRPQPHPCWCTRAQRNTRPQHNSILYYLLLSHHNHGRSDIEDHIIKACDAAKSQKRPNIAKLAREFDVPVTRLRARFQGRQSRSSRPTTNKRLTERQELTLIRWIRHIDSICISPTAGMLTDYANRILKQNALLRVSHRFYATSSRSRLTRAFCGTSRSKQHL